MKKKSSEYKLTHKLLLKQKFITKGKGKKKYNEEGIKDANRVGRKTKHEKEERKEGRKEGRKRRHYE